MYSQHQTDIQSPMKSPKMYRKGTQKIEFVGMFTADGS